MKILLRVSELFKKWISIEMKIRFVNATTSPTTLPLHFTETALENSAKNNFF